MVRAGGPSRATISRATATRDARWSAVASGVLPGGGHAVWFLVEGRELMFTTLS